MPDRINLDEQTSPGRQGIDANWSRRRKIAVGVASAAIAIGAVGAGGYAAWYFTPPKIPTTAEEAIATLNSSKFDRLDLSRQQQIVSEAGRLLREMPPERWRELVRDPEQREAMRKLWEETMDEAVRRFARGEQMPGPFGMGRPGGPGGRPGGPPGGWRRGPEGGEGERPDPNSEEAQQRRAEMVARRNEQVQGQVQQGNAQTGGLMVEMFKAMRRQGGRAGQRPGGGGGQPGGGGSGGGG